MQFQYSFGGSTKIRAAYGKGIARPNFGDLPPFEKVDTGGVITNVTAGNPDRKPTHAHNFDILFERYLKTVGIIGDQYLYPHTQVDAQVMYRLPRVRDFQVVASFLNLTNEVFGFYLGSEKYPNQREYYNRSYSFGLR